MDDKAITRAQSSRKPLRTASDVAYSVIRDLILRTELKPGQVLAESELMSALKIGRTPLRDALRLLSHDGLVDIEPRRGTTVAPLRSSDLNAIFEVRIAIEPLIADAAIARATPLDHEHLRALAEQAERNSETQSDVSLDEELHRQLVGISRNRFLVDFYKRLRDESLRFRFLTGSGLDSKEQQSVFIRGVSESLDAGDKPRLSGLLVRHVEEFQQTVWQALSQASHLGENLSQEASDISLSAPDD